MKKQQYWGYTIFELIIFMVVMGILATVIGINIVNYNDTVKLDRAGRMVLADVRYAQEMAMSSNRGVDFNVGTTGYSLTWDDGTILQSTFGKGSVEVDLADLDASISGSDISFNHIGLPNGTVTLTVTNRSGSKSIRINGTTGYSELD